MAAELVAERRQQPGAEGFLLPGTKALVQGGGDGRRRHGLFHRLVHRPAAFAGIVHIGGQAFQVGVGFQGAHGQVKQPGTHYAAVLPGFGDGEQVQPEIVLSGLQQLKAFGVGLHQGVFHAVMHHFGEVAGAGGAHVGQALIRRRGQGLKDGFQTAVGVGIAAHHQGVAVDQAPDAAAGAGVQQVDAQRRQVFAPAHSVLVVGVAAVDDGVAGGQQAGQFVHNGVGDGAGGQHQPHGAGRRQPVNQRRRRGGGGAAGGGRGGHRIGVPVIDHYPMAAVEQPPGHIAAHAAQANHPDFQGCPSPLARPTQSRFAFGDTR